MEKQTAQLTQEQFRLRALKEAGISYSLSAILPVLLSFLFVIVLTVIGGEHEKEDWYIYFCCRRSGSVSPPRFIFGAAAFR